MQAVVVAVVTAILSLMIFPLGYLSSAAVALVVLRVGVISGLKVAAIATLISGIMAMLLMHNPWIGAGFLLLMWLPVIALAVYLRKHADLKGALYRAAVLGCMVVTALFMVLDDPVAWWNNILTQLFTEAFKGIEGSAKSITDLSNELAPIMTGLIAVAFVVQTTGSLLLARWWQATLFNPGGFRDEFQQLRFDKGFMLITMLLITVASVTDGVLSLYLIGLFMICAFILMLQGLAIVHAVVRGVKAHHIWLVLLYGMMVIAMPQTAITLAVAALVDNWFDIRAYIEGRKV